jgi:GNAT superfamily N-acetyltransferase
MHFSLVTIQDLEALRNLQPPDWSDIIPDVRYYIEADFCYPLKVEVDNEIAGLGAAIVYGDTAWLAHIIVHSDFRNKGIGYTIVKELLDIINTMKVSSCLLTATALGKPVYEKAGFKSVSEYVFMNREKPWIEKPASLNILDYNEKFREQIYQMDWKASGEDRRLLLSDFIQDAKVFVEKEKVLGYCIPRLKEGPIIAQNPEAGIELMKIKYSTSEKAVIPVENDVALDFLLANGFKPTETRGTRMVLGNDVDWEPANIYSRAGGNFG